MKLPSILRRRAAALPLLALLPALHAQGVAVPSLMSYQGRVSDAGGTLIGNVNPVNRAVTFRLYHSPGEGDAIYAETQTVTISAGEFSVLIGNGTGVQGLPGPSAPALTPFVTLPDVVNSSSGEALYLGITVDDGNSSTADLEIVPRQQLVSGAFTLRAKTAEGVLGGAITSAMLGDSSVTTNSLKSDAVSTAKIQNNAVTTSKILDSAITAGKLDAKTIGLWTPSGLNNENVYRTGNVGIGQSNPAVPLSFGDTFGDKIALFGSGNSSKYGFGVQSNLLQLFSPSNTADIALGYGSSSSFTEHMRVKGTGNVGIGTSAPAGKLHVNGGGLIVQNSANPGINVNAGGAAQANLSLATTSGAWSNAAAANDTVLRAVSGKLHLQSGTGNSAISIDTSNRAGFGTAAPSTTIEAVGAIHARDNSVSADNSYHGALRTTRASSAAQHINMVRSGQAVWSIGYVPNTSNFGIGGGAGTDSSFNPAFRITPGGIVGVGTTDTQARLNVSDTTASYESFGRLTTNGGNGDNSNYTNIPLSIKASGHILCAQVDISSDARLKNILRTSDGARDLETLSGIQITDYEMRDKIQGGGGLHKKVIAQQVESVFPEAVHSRSGVVPDLYRNATVKNGWVLMRSDLEVGERVRILDTGNDSVREVIAVRNDGFRLDLDPTDERVFVYGREVDDLRSVDYNAISMLNVSATQELNRKMLQLEKESSLKESRIKELEQRLEKLEELLGAGQ